MCDRSEEKWSRKHAHGTTRNRLAKRIIIIIITPSGQEGGREGATSACLPASSIGWPAN